METSKAGKRLRRSKQERRAIVEETLKPGKSVAQIAREHGVNANQLFAWRKLYREGRLELPETSNALVRVRISDAVAKLQTTSRPARKPIGLMDIDLGHARVRIEGAADPDCVRAAIEALLR